MEAGKHVLIEKPVATALSDAERLLEIRDRTKRVAAVDFMMRFTPLAEILARWTINKPFGDLRHATVENHAQDEFLPPDHWFWNSAQSGGILVEHARALLRSDGILHRSSTDPRRRLVAPSE